MPPRAPARRPPPPRRKIVWLRAAPIFVGMMALLLGGQLYLLPRYPDNPIFANGGLGLSLIAGLLGAFLISRYATEVPPPPPSKSQQRKLAAADRAKQREDEDDVEEEETQIVASRPAARRRGRRRR